MGGDLSGYIVLEGLEIIGYSGIRPVFLPLLYELMNNAGSTHVATPDHVAIMAAFISAKYFSMPESMGEKTHRPRSLPQALCLSCHGSIVPK